MWPALVVAAAAGSGFLAKKIFNQNATEPTSGSTENDSKCAKPNDPEVFTTSFLHKDSIFTSICDKPSDLEGFITPLQHKDSIFTSNYDKPFDPQGFNTCFQHKDSSFICNLGCSIQEKSEGFSDGSIFRFSSASGSEMGFRNLRKKNVEGSRKTKGNAMEWKVNSGGKLVVAAAAGSGFLAKKIFNQNATEPTSGSTENDSKCAKPNDPEVFTTSFLHKDSIFTSICDKPSDLEGFITPLQHKDSIFTSNYDKPFDPQGFNTCFQHKDSSFICNLGCSIQEKSEGFSDGSIFRFSSASGSEMGFRNLRKKNVEGSRKTKGNAMEWKGNSGGKLGGKCGNGEKELFRLDQRNRGSGKRFYVCLKKRKTNKVPSGKCDSCASKGNSLFGYGLGIGMMCMMSAGKSEINRLNTTMDETAKAVEELKAEISRRKVAHNLRISKNKGDIDEKNDRECRIRAIAESTNGNRNIYRALDLQVAEECECASSVITEEPQLEVMEMDQLEAELESELLKLPWCATEDTDLKGGRDPCRDGFLEKEINQADKYNVETYQFSGVLPSELDQKLCHLLIEQQEGQIVELESELRQTHSKLQEKEAELQALKDCVRRLTEFSLDEETDGKMEDEIIGGGDQEKKIGPESGKSIVGMKRSMIF